MLNPGVVQYSDDLSRLVERILFYMEQMIIVDSIPSCMFRVFPTGWSIEMNNPIAVIDNHGKNGVWDDVRNNQSIDIYCGNAIDSPFHWMVMESVFVIL